jgi:hypothetical protein
VRRPTLALAGGSIVSFLSRTPFYIISRVFRWRSLNLIKGKCTILNCSTNLLPANELLCNYMRPHTSWSNFVSTRSFEEERSTLFCRRFTFMQYSFTRKSIVDYTAQHGDERLRASKKVNYPFRKINHGLQKVYAVFDFHVFGASKEKGRSGLEPVCTRGGRRVCVEMMIERKSFSGMQCTSYTRSIDDKQS